MADIGELNVYNTTVTSVLTSGLTDGLVAQTINRGGSDEKLMLYWRATSTDTDALITINAGDGLRADIGDLAVTATALSEGLIYLGDSARFGAIADDDIDISVTDTAGATATVLAATVKLTAMQL